MSSRSLLSVVLVGAAVLTAAGWGGVRPSPVRAEGPCPVPADFASLDIEEQAALDGINTLRGQAGLAPLSVSGTLMRAARWKALDMAAGAPFGHDDTFRSWTQRLADCGYRGGAFSENIAAGAGAGAAVVGMWWNSPPHQANMMDPTVSYIGIARAQGGAYGWYWTATFGATAGDAITTDATADHGQ